MNKLWGVEDEPPSKEKNSKGICSNIRNNRVDSSDLYWFSLRLGGNIKGLAVHSIARGIDLR
jgi:hypothetical protein